jgi:hypothetical protein
VLCHKRLLTRVLTTACLSLLLHCSRSKYWLHSLVRTNMAADEASYNCVMEMEDAEGHRGVKLSKDLMKIAGGCRGFVWEFGVHRITSGFEPMDVQTCKASAASRGSSRSQGPALSEQLLFAAPLLTPPAPPPCVPPCRQGAARQHHRAGSEPGLESLKHSPDL